MGSLTLIVTLSVEFRTHSAKQLRGLQSANWPREDQCQRHHAHEFLSYSIRYPEVEWTSRSCGMAGCWQINFILANAGRKENSNLILNQYVFLWNTPTSIVYLFHEVFIIL